MARPIIILIIVTLLGFSCKRPNPIKLEKIIFHTSFCFGTCPTYHLQIDSNKQVKLFAEEVYQGKSLFLRDSTKMGYFIGEIPDTTFIKLAEELQSIGIDTLKFDGVNCCDGSVKTIIVYYNGKRKYLKSMFPPKIAENLIDRLNNICRNYNFKRTTEKFKIEE